MNTKYKLITFKSVTFAIQFEKEMKKNEIPVKLIPVPRSISSSCGMCGRFEDNFTDKITQICSENNLLYDNIYDMAM